MSQATIEQIKSSYEELTYDSLPFAQCNLRMLETVGDLYGIETPDLRGCRVLEIGTATGKSIISQAEDFPHTEFIGIDLAEKQVRDGNEFIKSLGLKNVVLKAANIMDIDDSWGKFDYILAHGVYSWVPCFVQEKMLDVASQNLSPNGLAMYSYNVYPGWHFNMYARDLMNFHAKSANQFPTPQETVSQARAVINFLAKSLQDKNNHVSQFFEFFRTNLRTQEDHYVYHEFLELDNHPCYFYEFLEKIKSRKMAYVSDTDWTYFYNLKQTTELGKALDSSIPFEFAEQYIDFAENRSFRSSIFCHESAKISSAIKGNWANSYWVAFYPDVEVTKGHEQGFIDVKRNKIHLGIPETPASELLLAFLKENIDTFVRFEAIWEHCSNRMPNALTDGTLSRPLLSQLLEKLVASNIARLLKRTVESSGRDSSRPLARIFARGLAKKDANAVVGPYFDRVKLDFFSVHVLRLLDGRHTPNDIVTDVQKVMKKGNLSIAYQNKPVSCNDRETIMNLVNIALDDFRKYQIIPKSG